VRGRPLYGEAVLPGWIQGKLAEAKQAAYRRPMVGARHGRPARTWPRQIPTEGEPAEGPEIVADYADWLSSSEVPKLLVRADPGAILNGAPLEFCRAWPNQTEVTVAGNHFVQEDSPHEIGEALAAWLTGLR